jgi:hypothetical protein
MLSFIHNFFYGIVFEKYLRCLIEIIFYTPPLYKILIIGYLLKYKPLKMKDRVNKYKQALFFVTVLAIIVSCKKNNIAVSPTTTPITPTSHTTSQNYSKTYYVGNGSGDLTVDGNVTPFLANSLIVITAGTYQTISVKNLNSTTIQNGNAAVIMDGTSNIYAGINFTNCSNDTITRNPAIADAYPFGFICQNNTYRPTTIFGVNKNMEFEYLSYKNIGDYTITISDNTLKVWDGTDASLQGLNLKFNYCKFDNCNAGVFSFGGDVSTSSVTGLQKQFEVGFCTFINCDSGDLCFAGAIDKYSIHDNYFNNINSTNNNDNGLFHMVGNGDFYQNYAVNYQGHLIRMWTISFGKTPENCLVYNNICFGARKYSPFEWQSTEGLNVVVAPNTTFCNIKINNNTAGNLNTSHTTSFDACLVDNYSMPVGSTQEVYNNLLYNTFASNAQGNRFFQFSSSADEAQLATFGNRYFSNANAAGFDEANLTLSANSPAKNGGVSGHLIKPLDFHQLPFNTLNPSTGAVQ